MNNVTISGTIKKVYDMTRGIVLISMENEEGTFNVFWKKNRFNFDCLPNSYVMIRGRLTYIKIKMAMNQNPKKLIAIEARSIERYDV